MPLPNKINWKEKPRSWEWILMSVAAVVTVGQLVWLFQLSQSTSRQHEEKLQKIEGWTDAMLMTSDKAGSALAGLSKLDSQILSLPDLDDKEGLAVLQETEKHWSVPFSRLCAAVFVEA